MITQIKRGITYAESKETDLINTEFGGRNVGKCHQRRTLPVFLGEIMDR